VSRYSPTVAQAKAVTDYLKANGLHQHRGGLNRLLVSADGNSGDHPCRVQHRAEAVQRRRPPGVRQQQPAQVPSRLSGIVNAVVRSGYRVAFHTMLQKRTSARTRPLASSPPRSEGVSRR